jgi:hypothetical protein
MAAVSRLGAAVCLSCPVERSAMESLPPRAHRSAARRSRHPPLRRSRDHKHRCLRREEGRRRYLGSGGEAGDFPGAEVGREGDLDRLGGQGGQLRLLTRLEPLGDHGEEAVGEDALGDRRGGRPCGALLAAAGEPLGEVGGEAAAAGNALGPSRQGVADREPGRGRVPSGPLQRPLDRRCGLPGPVGLLAADPRDRAGLFDRYRKAEEGGLIGARGGVGVPGGANASSSPSPPAASPRPSPPPRASSRPRAWRSERRAGGACGPSWPSAASPCRACSGRA